MLDNLRPEHELLAGSVRVFSVALTWDRCLLMPESLILPQRRFGVLCAALTPIRKTQLVIGIRLFGLQANGGFQALCRRFQVAFFEKSFSQFVVWIGIIRSLPNNVREENDRLRLPLLHKQNVAETVLRRCVARIGPQLRPKIFFRLLKLALAEANHATAVIGLRQFRIYFERARKFLQG